MLVDSRVLIINFLISLASQLIKSFYDYYFITRLLISPSTNSVLIDDAAAKPGDLYIRSLCFSPDGKLLATGAEDNQVRVSF